MTMTDNKEKWPKILLVDDMPDIIELLEEILSNYNIQVFTAESGNKAFKVFQENQIDLILSDIKMPDGDGIELLEMVKNSKKEMPYFIFITGHLAHRKNDLIQMGANNLFTKPFLIKDIMEEIEKHVTLTPRKKVSFSI